MNKPGLSSRMAAAAALVPREGVIVDIGTDHGRLAVWLAAQGRSVIATDVSGPSLQKAVTLARRYGVSLDCREGNGLTPLKAGEADAAVMAGMGALTMVDILDKAPEKTLSLSCLVLQPMNAVHIVRRWIHDHGFGVTGEAFARERHGIYPLLQARRGVSDPAERFDCLVGNWEMAARHPLFEAYLRQQLRRCRDQLAGARRSGGAAAARRTEQIESEIMIYEGAMEWFARRGQS